MSIRLSVAPALLAAASLVATPAFALPAPATAQLPQAAHGGEALSYHRWYRYNRGPSVGDVLAGVLIVGGIAAIASAATRASRDDRYRDRSYPPPPPRYRGDEARAVDRAVSLCVDALERDVRVDSVDRVERQGDGWRVSGALAGGRPFTCGIGRDGRIEALDYEGSNGRWRGAEDEARDRQYGDDRYARAWSDRDRDSEDQPAPSPPAAEGPQPAYPGGPLPGDEPQDDGSV